MKPSPTIDEIRALIVAARQTFRDIVGAPRAGVFKSAANQRAHELTALLSMLDARRDAVIEECAKAAEEVNVNFCNMIAMRIRALKSAAIAPGDAQPGGEGVIEGLWKYGLVIESAVRNLEGKSDNYRAILALIKAATSIQRAIVMGDRARAEQVPTEREGK